MSRRISPKNLIVLMLILPALVFFSGRVFCEDEPSLEQLTEQMSDKEPLVRLKAVNLLARMRSSESLPYLKEAVKDDDFRVRVAAVQALGLVRDKTSVQEISYLLGSDPHTSVKLASVIALGHIQSRESMPYLIKALKEEKVTGIKIKACSILGNFDDPASSEALLKTFTDDPDRGVRMAAADGLGYMSGTFSVEKGIQEKIVTAMIKAYGREQNRDVKGAIIRNLPSFSGMKEKVIEFMLSVLNDAALGDEEKLRAASALGKIKRMEGYGISLAKALDPSASLDIRKAAIDALGDIGNTQAGPMLWEVLKDTGTSSDLLPSLRTALLKLGVSEEELK